MSNGKSETSTFEMETRESFDKILLAITGMRQEFNQTIGEMREEFNQRLDKIETEQIVIKQDFKELKHFVELQFDAIRQGLVQNYQETIQLEKDTAENRMSLATVKSVVSEINERLYQMSRATEKSF